MVPFDGHFETKQRSHVDLIATFSIRSRDRHLLDKLAYQKIAVKFLADNR